MSAHRPTPPDRVLCPHCQGSIPITYDGIPPGAWNVSFSLDCPYCGDRIRVRAKDNPPSQRAEVAG